MKNNYYDYEKEEKKKDKRKMIIAYLLAISTLLGAYKIKNKEKIGKDISDTTENTFSTESVINTTDNGILETINETSEVFEETIETTIMETSEVLEETIETTATVPKFDEVFIPSFATDDLALFDDNNNVIYMVEKYEKLTITKIFENKVECLTTDGYFGYTYFNLLKQLPETYAEVDISMQKVYCYYQGELVLIADCVTGIPTYGTTKGTNKGYTEINGKAYNTTLMLDTPAEIFISFNPDGEGFHDSKRSQFGGDIYLTNGSHGCVNMRLEDVKVLDKHLKAGDHVLVHK